MASRRRSNRTRPVPTPVADQVNTSNVNELSRGVVVAQPTFDLVEVPKLVIREEVKTMFSDGSVEERVQTYARNSTKQWR